MPVDMLVSVCNVVVAPSSTANTIHLISFVQWYPYPAELSFTELSSKVGLCRSLSARYMNASLVMLAS